MNFSRLILACSISMISAYLSQAGETATVFSGVASKGGFRDGPLSGALYQSPQGLAIAASNSLLVADCRNSRIRCIQGNITTTFAGSGAYGRNDSQSRDTATFENPQCILPLSDGSVLVGDRSRVRIIRPNGVVATWMDLLKTTPGSLAHITSMALGTNGIVYVCDRINKRIYTRTSDGMTAGQREAPPRNATVALPLLAKYTPSDGLSYIEKVLGKCDLDCGSAIHDLWYRMNDGSSVRVRATYSGEVISIERQGTHVAGNEIIFDSGKTRQSTNHTSDGIRQPADGLSKPSR